MKQVYASLTTFLLVGQLNQAAAQCTPVNCLGSLPAYGGICDIQLADGTVGTLYSDFESFHFTDVCFDVGSISPPNAGTYAKLTMVDNFTFGGLPAGLTGSTNAAAYVPPANGCILFQGVPTEAGIFSVSSNMLLDGNVWPFSAVCSGFSLAQNDLAFGFQLDLKINPNPAFTIPATNFCVQDAAVALTTTGTPGGTFSGPGVSGANFDPAVAGIGTHVIWYHVSAQQGAAVAAATDSASVSVTVTAPANNYYPDADNDTYGDNSAAPTAFCSATPPAGYSSNNLDCDDTNNGIHPGAIEIPSNGIDEDCDGVDAAVDNDADGYDNTVDCNDNNNTVYPGAPEICDGLDNNCDGTTDEGFTLYTYYQDSDNDTYGNAAVTLVTCASPAPAGYVSDNTDCDDTNNAVHPGAMEICDGVDNDCSGVADDNLTTTTYYLDADLDGYGVAASTIDTCLAAAPIGYAAIGGDCDDANPNVNPGMPEICDGQDNNCSGGADEGLTINTYYEDADSDGYGNPAVSTTNCGPVPGYVNNDEDCDDTNELINPGVADTFGNGVDENCDGVDGSVGLDAQAVWTIEMHPNPASASVLLSGPVTTELSIVIYTMQGGVVSHRVVTMDQSCQLDVSQLLQGSYFVEVTDVKTGAARKMKLMIAR